MNEKFEVDLELPLLSNEALIEPFKNNSFGNDESANNTMSELNSD